MFKAQLRPDLYLSLLEARHAQLIFQAVERDREYLRQWLPWVDRTRSEEDIASFILGALERFVSSGEITAGIWCDDHFCGVIGNHKTDRQHAFTQIGYWLAADWQQRGIMTEACRALTRHCLVELGLNRVEILCATENGKSCAIP